MRKFQKGAMHPERLGAMHLVVPLGEADGAIRRGRDVSPLVNVPVRLGLDLTGAATLRTIWVEA